MEVLYEKCAGLDVHKDLIVACLRTASGGRGEYEIRKFGTTTAELFALSSWLKERGATHVAMEATGVYWKPVWNILSDSFELVLGNARRMRNVPGRKSDVNDATWISDLLAHGLVQPSFVPERPVQELRDLTRTRKQLTRDMADASNRVQKVLEDANIKVGSVLSDVFGMSGRAILDAIVAGETNPQKLASLASDRVKAPRSELVAALQGKVTPHHRFMLATHLRHHDELAKLVADIDARIGEVGRPFDEAVARLELIPGISRSAAFALIGEIGADMGRFQSAQHLVSFAGVCPRLEESAGKKKSTRSRRAGTWLKGLVVACAWAAKRTRGSYFRAQYHRIKARRGPMKALIAVASSLVTAIYHVLRGADFHDAGERFFDQLNHARTVHRLTKRLESLGFSVALSPAA